MSDPEDLSGEAGAPEERAAPDDPPAKGPRQQDAGAAGPPRIEDVEEDALDFLEALLDAMEFAGEVTSAPISENEIQLTIEGSDSGLLIGRRGSTLDAVQELLRSAIQHRSGRGIRLTLDIEGYRERKRESVTQQAKDAIERAREDGEVELIPMTAYERKLVHDLVAEAEGVTSFSEGEDPDRWVVIRSEEG